MKEALKVTVIGDVTKHADESRRLCEELVQARGELAEIKGARVVARFRWEKTIDDLFAGRDTGWDGSHFV